MLQVGIALHIFPPCGSPDGQSAPPVFRLKRETDEIERASWSPNCSVVSKFSCEPSLSPRHVKQPALRMKTVELGRKTPQPFSTFTFKIRKRKRKRTNRTRKRTRIYGISRISTTNQFERNYVEHGRYTKIQYEIPTHSA